MKNCNIERILTSILEAMSRRAMQKQELHLSQFNSLLAINLFEQLAICGREY